MFAIVDRFSSRGANPSIVEVEETYILKMKQERGGYRKMKDTNGKIHSGAIDRIRYFETEEQAEKYLDLLAEKATLQTALRNALDRIRADCSSLELEQPAYVDRVYRSNLRKDENAGWRNNPEVEIHTLIYGPVDEVGKTVTRS